MAKVMFLEHYRDNMIEVERKGLPLFRQYSSRVNGASIPGSFNTPEGAQEAARTYIDEAIYNAPVLDD